MADFVFFGSPSDPHIRRVSDALTKRGARITCLASLSDEEDGATWPGWNSNVAGPAGPTSIRREDAGSVFSPKTVWWMRNKARIFEIQSEDDQRREFEIATRQELAESLAATFGGRRINPSYRQTLNKIGQLSNAAKVGMRIPRTVVTSERSTALDFLDQVGPSIAKPLGISYVAGIKGDPATAVSVMTNEISRSEVSDRNS